MNARILISITLFGSVVFADNVRIAGHTYPEQIEADGKDWVLTGAAVYKHKGWINVFTAGRYVDEDNANSQKLRLTYCRDLKAEVFVRESRRALERQFSSETLEKFAKPTQAFFDAYTNVEKNETYTLKVVEGSHTALLKNGREIVRTAGSAFGNYYVQIWTGPDPISDTMRESLLGNGKR